MTNMHDLAKRYAEFKNSLTKPLSKTPTQSESVGFVFGTTNMENPNVTREMATEAVKKRTPGAIREMKKEEFAKQNSKKRKFAREVEALCNKYGFGLYQRSEWILPKLSEGIVIIDADGPVKVKIVDEEDLDFNFKTPGGGVV